jgi:predicted MFS family arabinose efflux permease
VTQNASMTLMLNRVGPSGYGTVSAIWNLAFDAGIGAGAFGFGVLAAQTGYPAAFAVTALVVLVALVPLWRDRTAPVG